MGLIPWPVYPEMTSCVFLYLKSLLSFQPNQDKVSNFGLLDLNWIDTAKGLTEVLNIGDGFLGQPDKITNKNRMFWCNLHILPAMPNFVVETRAYNEVVCWALGNNLGSVEDLTKPGMAILLTTFPRGLWDKTVGIVRLVVHPQQALMPVAEAVQILRLHFSQSEKDPYFMLIPFHKTCFKLSSTRVPSGNGTIAMAVAVFILNLWDNTVDLSKTDGVIGTLLAHRLLSGPAKEIPGDTAIVLPQLSIPRWSVRAISVL